MNCIICNNPTITFFNIMKEFCSNFEKIKDNICKNHAKSFNEKRFNFLMRSDL